MNKILRNIKKAQLTIILFLISFGSFAADCFPGDLGCETDDPLDSHILILMIFVAILAIYTLNKKVAKALVA